MPWTWIGNVTFLFGTDCPLLGVYPSSACILCRISRSRFAFPSCLLGRIWNLLDTILGPPCLFFFFVLIFELIIPFPCPCPTAGRNMWWVPSENSWITALCLQWCYAKQKYSFLQRNRSVVILLQQWNCSRGEHKSSSIYIFNEPQLKVVGWRVRVNVLFSDFYSRPCCCWSKRHFPGTLGLPEP